MVVSMSEWQVEDYLDFGEDYDRPRTKQEIAINRERLFQAEQLVQELERFDSENFHWYERVGHEVNGEFEKYPGELKNYNGYYLNLNEQREVRRERQTLMKIRDLIGFNEYHSDQQQDDIIQLYLIYRKYGLNTNVISKLMNKKTSYFRSTNFVKLEIKNGANYQKGMLQELNSKLHQHFDKNGRAAELN